MGNFRRSVLASAACVAACLRCAGADAASAGAEGAAAAVEASRQKAREVLEAAADPKGVGVLDARLLPPSIVKNPAPQVAAGKKTPLSLQSAIDSAMRGNLSLIYRRYDPEMKAQDIEVQEAVFEPRLSLSVDYKDRRDARATSSLDGSPIPESNNFSYDFSIQQKISTGASLRLFTSSSRSWSNSTYSLLNPDFGANIGLEATQPLLKGAGTVVNLAPIALARSYKRQSELELKKQILDTVLNSEVAYWNLSAAYAFRDLRKSNLELAKKLLEENKAKLAVGIIRRQDVLQAEANLALAEEQMISAEQLIEKNNDELLGSFGRLEFDNNPKFSVAVLPQDDIEMPDFGSVISGALAFDLDLQIALEAVEQSKIDSAVADDNVNPTLNIRAGGSVLGRDGTYLDSYKNATDARGYSWNAGVDVILPWGLREERARQAKAMLGLRRSHVNLANIRQDLMMNLRLAYRDLESGIESRRSAARTLALNVESFDQQKALYDVGLTTFRDVLQSQRDLDESKRRYLDAVYAVILAQAKLSRLDGTILKRHGFNWGALGEYELPPSNMARNE